MELSKRIVVEGALLGRLDECIILLGCSGSVGRSNNNLLGGDGDVQDDSASDGSDRGSGNMDTHD
jgi:hypothetical protein